jgi:hypothetical protein
MNQKRKWIRDKFAATAEEAGYHEYFSVGFDIQQSYLEPPRQKESLQPRKQQWRLS